MTRRLAALLIAAAFLPALALKCAHVWRANDPGVDGGYYTEVATHVRDGEGLSTNVSLYHQGFERFPHASPIYPVWPLVYGWSARVIPMPLAGRVVPALCWALAALFAASWARQLSPGPICGNAAGIDAGHAVALLVALNAVLFRYTSRPYTEGLSFALLFAGLRAFHPRWSRLDMWTGFAIGAWLGLLVLVRSHLVVVAMAAACTLAFAALVVAPRGRHLGAALACGSAFAATLTPQLLRLAEWSLVAPWVALLRFEMARERDALSPMDVLRDGSGGLTGHLRDLVEGIPVAFSPVGSMTYERVFHGLQYALPLALVVIAADAVAGIRAGRAREFIASWSRPERLPEVFALALAAGGLLSLHFIRKDFTTEWHFARRHALTAIFAFVLAWLHLVRHRSAWVRGLALALMSFVLVMSHAQALKAVRRESVDRIRKYDALLQALEEERDRASPLAVAIHGDHLQRIAWRTSGIGYHWIYDRTTASDVEALARLGVRWVVLEPGHTAAWPLRAALEAPRWKRRPDVDGFEVYEAIPASGEIALPVAHEEAP